MVQLMGDHYRDVLEGVVNDRWMHRSLLMRLLSMPPITRLVDFLAKRTIRKAAERGEAQQGVIPPRPAHFDFRTPEYTSFKQRSRAKWGATAGMSPSFGFNRAHGEADDEDAAEQLHSFIDTVSKNGNLLLNVGERGEEASIPPPTATSL